MVKLEPPCFLQNIGSLQRTEMVRWGDSSPQTQDQPRPGSGLCVDTGNVENEPILCSYKS